MRLKCRVTRIGKGGFGVKKRLMALLTAAFALLMLFVSALPAAALDDTYRFNGLGMSVRISKSYYVITRDTPADDAVFTTLNLNYRDTMRLFEDADIYLRAFDPDGTFQISLTVRSDRNSKSVNNYTELGESKRRGILDALLGEEAVTSAVEVRRGNYLFFDTSRETTLDGEPLYVNQCNTIVNGLQIDLSLQKTKEKILPAEARVLTAVASSIEFDSVKKVKSGPVFDWWRLLLWVAILAGLTVSLSYVYKHRNESRRRKLEECRRKRSETLMTITESSDTVMINDRTVTFEETLGYHEAERFSSRAAADLDVDISVREKNPSRGMSYFEDGGKSIDDRSDDYFAAYFREPTPTRAGIARMFSVLGANIAIVFRHLGYFMKNLLRMLTGKHKKRK